jgi:hypothetical protein
MSDLDFFQKDASKDQGKQIPKGGGFFDEEESLFSRLKISKFSLFTMSVTQHIKELLKDSTNFESSREIELAKFYMDLYLKHSIILHKDEINIANLKLIEKPVIHKKGEKVEKVEKVEKTPNFDSSEKQYHDDMEKAIELSIEDITKKKSKDSDSDHHVDSLINEGTLDDREFEENLELKEILEIFKQQHIDDIETEQQKLGAEYAGLL